MSTVIWLRSTATVPSAYSFVSGGVTKDALTVNGTGLVNATMKAGATLPASGEFLLTMPGTFTPLSWWSERITAQVTISGAIAVALRPNTTAGGTVRLRMKIFKITAGGSNVVTLIGQADGTADLATTNSAYTISITPPAPVTLVANERFIIELYAIPNPSTGWGTPSAAYANVPFSGNSSISDASITFTETITFKDNATFIKPRRTTGTGIGVFMDLLTATGATAFTTAVVNTAAGGTEIQWTKTAGGTVAEWISGRLKAPGWTITSVANFVGNFNSQESNLAANCASTIKVFKRKPDGTEALVFTRTQDLEMGTASAVVQLTGAGGTSTLGAASDLNCAEDDRIVVRLYIHNVGGTMGGGFTCTVNYDHNTVPATKSTLNTSDCYFWLLDGPEFKAEGDPAGTSRVPGAQTMLGIGN